MDSSSRETNREENLNDSWVDIHFQQQQQQQLSTSMSTSMAPPQNFPSGVSTPEIRPACAPTPPLTGLCSGQMEKLLLEAQRESRGSSRYSSQPSSSRASPKSPHSPINEMAPGIRPIQEGQVLQAVQKANIPTDWIWDWSSRPEVLPQPHNNNGGGGSDVSSNGSRGGGGQYQHPQAPASSSCGAVSGSTVLRRSRLSVRNSPVLRAGGAGGILDHLSTLLLTHACSFLLGAAAMFLYIKKYSNWTLPIKSSSIID